MCNILKDCFSVSPQSTVPALLVRTHIWRRSFLIRCFLITWSQKMTTNVRVMHSDIIQKTRNIVWIASVECYMWGLLASVSSIIDLHENAWLVTWVREVTCVTLSLKGQEWLCCQVCSPTGVSKSRKLLIIKVRCSNSVRLGGLIKRTKQQTRRMLKPEKSATS